MPKVLVPLAQGCEEIEAATIIDILRRAGIDTVSAGLDAHPVRASRGMVLLPDTTLDAALGHDYDMVVLPGGQPGTDNLKADTRIRDLLKHMAQQGKITAAICAAPSVLAAAGLLDGRKATCYPTCLDGFPKVHLQPAAVVEDGNLITSRGPGTAMDFALALVERLAGRAKRKEVEAGLAR
ncbi:MAG: 4-methyl-5(b-hydroxyethyl)-thiazole monophosphate biosynthesi [Gallionellaceae bacterium]|nr:MAG: 4-methyl-5(b-hydroxyethyl)-thiazole monophosphate biosynthesi [Gallionellaceae bacterium]